MKKISFNENWVYYPSKMDKSPCGKIMPVTLPHDATICEKRHKDVAQQGRKGYFPGGRYTYEKSFFVSSAWKGKKVYLFFEGIYRNARIYVNGVYADQCISGYEEICLDVTKYLEYEKENQVKVMLSAGDDSRWYAGAGIYRNTWILVADTMHIAHNGVRITTKSVTSQLAALEADITLENHDLCNHVVTVATAILDKEGNCAGKDSYSLRVYTGETEKISPRIYVKNPKLWDCEEPNLYTCHVEIREGDTILDEEDITFGIRTLTLDPVDGLCINGKTVKLYGGCIHHDNGLIGSVSLASAEERRIRKLKEAGYNAIRCAHNPASRALLDACDKYGMTVMDELTDMWMESKNWDDDAAYFARNWEHMAETLVAKDYNHPSVIFYSTGNEIPELGRADGAKMARDLSNKLKALDDTRYVTCGVNGIMSNLYRIQEIFGEGAGAPANDEGAKEALEINSLMTAMGNHLKSGQSHPKIIESTIEAMESLDVAGYNYAETRYEADTEAFTNWITLGSETFPKDIAGNWKLVMEHGNVLGDYTWTSWDYLGEAGVGKNHWQTELNGAGNGSGEAYPYLTAYCGDIDITGVRRAQSYYRQIVVEKQTKPFIAVQDPGSYGKEIFVTPWSWFPVEGTWTFPGCEGKKTAVEVYSCAQEVELFINGVSWGRKPVLQETNEQHLAYLVNYEVIYEPGVIEVAAYEGDEIVARHQMITAQEETTLCAKADWKGKDLIYIPIGFYDKQGVLNTAKEQKITVHVTGKGSLYGLGTGRPATEESYKDNSCTTYMGQALAIIRPNGEGEIKVEILADGHEKVEITI